MLQLLALLVLASSFLVQTTHAYIPAVSVNNTGGLVQSDDTLHIAWLPNGVYSTGLSRQLVATPIDSNGNYTNISSVISWTKFSKGVLVHFNENFTSEAPSDVPWLALVNCDTNGTAGTFSLTDDIFTLARDHGAQAAVLYSLLGEGCLMNQDYLQNFEKVLDVYATNSQQGARLIESQFINVGGSAYNFSSAMMNSSASVIASLLNVSSLTVFGGDIPDPNYNATINAIAAASLSLQNPYSSTSTSLSVSATGQVARRGRLLPRATGTATSSGAPSAMTSGANYLAAVLAAANITVGGTAPAAAITSPVTSGGSGPNTSLAMIILYAITGVVTFMFLVVILSGAIRAIRHPERYGPRAVHRNGGHGGADQQSRARGLTRAILDTFPIVKFGRTAADDEDEEAEAERRRVNRDVEDGRTKDIELEERSKRSSGGTHDGTEMTQANNLAEASVSRDATIFESISPSDASPPSPAREVPLEETPLAIDSIEVDSGTCPICVCEFEAGEDLRVLPCDKRHRFHKDCIDPWLLQVSSLCPLCRLDLSGRKEEVGSFADQHQDDQDIIGEQMVISNLRAMLVGGRRGSSSNGSGSGSHSREGTGGSATGGNAVTRSRFFKYVANKRQARSNVGGEASTSTADPIVE